MKIVTERDATGRRWFYLADGWMLRDVVKESDTISLYHRAKDPAFGFVGRVTSDLTDFDDVTIEQASPHRDAKGNRSLVVWQHTVGDYSKIKRIFLGLRLLGAHILAERFAGLHT